MILIIMKVLIHKQKKLFDVKKKKKTPKSYSQLFFYIWYLSVKIKFLILEILVVKWKSTSNS